MSAPDVPALRAELAALCEEVAAKYRYHEALTRALHAAELYERQRFSVNLHRAEQALAEARKLRPGASQ